MNPTDRTNIDRNPRVAWVPNILGGGAGDDHRVACTSGGPREKDHPEGIVAER